MKIITIDGPSGVGKGTISTMISNYFGYKILDSGALYRVVAVIVIRNNLNPELELDVVAAMKGMKINFEPPYVYLNGLDITEKVRDENTGKIASKIAVHKKVRDELFLLMKDFAKPPGLVADGRDMGTEVFPNADLKIFLTANSKIRGERRFKQLRDSNKNVILEDVIADITSRDQRDMSREVAPLEPALDAVAIDTGDKDVLEVFELVKHYAAKNGILP